MEIANHLHQAGERLLGRVRQAEKGDARAIQQLLREAPASHIHVDWHVPGDWLGTPGFVVCVDSNVPQRLVSRLLERPPRLLGCLAIGADPPPAAWVRAAAATGDEPLVTLAALMTHVLPFLETEPIEQIGLLLTEPWPSEWPQALGFMHLTQIETHILEPLDVPPAVTVPGLQIQPVKPEEMSLLAEIEAVAFDPLWRHSATSLALARQQSWSFDVAILDDELVGFQFSTRSWRGAHLARMTVHPDYQGRGIGSALLAHAIAHYRDSGVERVTLNTQMDNWASKRLYERFGFRPSGEEFPVWVMEL